MFFRLMVEDLICQIYFARHNPGVLLVKLDAIGDFVVWLGCAHQLRRYFAGERITLVCNQAVAELASASGFFDEVIALQLDRFKNHWPYRLRILREIRRLGYSTAIQPTYSRSLMLGESIIRCSGACQRIQLLLR